MPPAGGERGRYHRPMAMQTGAIAASRAGLDFEMLAAAEEVLAATGNAVALCPVYGHPR
jgi:hypothetical protein